MLFPTCHKQKRDAKLAQTLNLELNMGSGDSAHMPLHRSCMNYISWQVIVSYEMRGNISIIRMIPVCFDSMRKILEKRKDECIDDAHHVAL